MVVEFFGFPGCGKTTHLAKTAVSTQRMIDRGLSRYKYVYTNAEIDYPGIRLIKWDYIGMYDYTDCLILIDEVGLNAHCRSYDRFPQRIVEWFCTHRHDRCDLYFYAQYYNQADKTIREVTEKLFYMRKSIIPGRTRIIKIPKTILIPKDTGDIKEGYRMPNFIERIFLAKGFSRRKYYKYFNSWSSYTTRLPAKYIECPGDPKPIDVTIASVVIPCRKFIDTATDRVRSLLRK